MEIENEQVIGEAPYLEGVEQKVFEEMRIADEAAKLQPSGISGKPRQILR